MASSYKLYTDSALTAAFAGAYNLLHNTDLSDNPQDFHLYFGSPTSAVVLQEASSPGVNQITLTPTILLDAWTVATAYTVGLNVKPTAPNGYRYSCTTAGTSHAATQPTWPTTVGATVTDGTVTWTCAALVHPATEIKLALTSGALAAATAGAALNLGTSISGGYANAVNVWIRITNTIITVGDNIIDPELSISINSCIESST